MSSPFEPWEEPRISDPHHGRSHAPEPEATTTDPAVRKLYGPKGEVLRTISDRPPVGFHQGERNR